MRSKRSQFQLRKHDESRNTGTHKILQLWFRTSVAFLLSIKTTLKVRASRTPSQHQSSFPMPTFMKTASVTSGLIIPICS